MSLESSDSEEKKVKVGFCWQLSDGRYLNGRDSDFVEQVLEDLQSFNKKDIRDSILIFPPFKNFHRFLIHNLVEENFVDLRTFSIGQSCDRRTVVCHKDRVIQLSTDQERSICGGVCPPMGIEHRTSENHEVNITSAYSGRKKARMLPDVALYQPPALRKVNEGTPEGSQLSRNPKPRQRRPDLAVYVPRALRNSPCSRSGVVTAASTPTDAGANGQQSRVELEEVPSATPSESLPPSSPLASSKGCLVTEAQASSGEEAASAGHGPLPQVPASEEVSALPSTGGGPLAEGSGCEGRGDSSGGRPREGEGRLECRGMGEALEGELVEEVMAAVGKVSVVEKPKSDYGLFRTDDASLSLAELTHVVEVFGFPAEFKTHDLVSILSPYGGRPGFEIKWVDDTHALAVFGSSFIAADVLNLRHPMLKTRAMEGASAASRAKARRICESLRIPYRPRPETCAALAQRLITGALGVQHRQSKAEREEERRLLREAREKRRSAARERDAAWEGTIASSLL
ncbi:R3H and coiled-coil domain-containing protein 1 isoform X2 [Hetaerina americana]|uniref:R3H and coiled-coil domain-containing protein 1 isoform X2 n=1 Tax=Hetaerina americana TaxID=62018 RepID=UPI003A7F13C4